MVEAMHGRRICGTWGTGRAVSLRPKPIEDGYMWLGVGSWQAVMADHKTNSNAQAILFAWKNDKPLPDDIGYFPEDKFKRENEEFSWEQHDLDAANEVERSPP